jgi:hypothetical protein
MALKIQIIEPLLRSMQGALSSSGLGNLFGGGGITSSGAIAGAVGPTSVGGAPLVGLHDGGIVGAEATFSRYVHPSYFDGAPKYHTGGIAGDEVPIIAKRGEGVFTQGQMAAMGGAGKAPQFTVNIVEDSSRAGQTEQSSNDSGGIDFTSFVDTINARNIANQGSATSRTLAQRGRLPTR